MKYLSLLLLIFLFGSCRQNTPSASKTAENAGTPLPEGFDAFYNDFLRDSLFQVSHINWPLEGDRGIQAEAGVIQVVKVKWKPEEWMMHRPTDYSTGDYRREVSTIGDIMVIERILTVAGNYGIERRFAKQPEGGWALIFYSDMRERN